MVKHCDAIDLFADEPSFCSICQEDLTAFPAEGRSLDEMNELAASMPRPLPECGS